METLWNFYSAWWSNIAGRIKHFITADIRIVVIRPGQSGIADLLLERTVMAADPNADKRAKPFINVTPLIDVLLVLLIIFMVVSPLKQARFVAKLPAPPNPPDRPLPPPPWALGGGGKGRDRKSTRLNSSHGYISYAVFCLKKKKHDITMM